MRPTPAGDCGSRRALPTGAEPSARELRRSITARRMTSAGSRGVKGGVSSAQWRERLVPVERLDQAAIAPVPVPDPIGDARAEGKSLHRGRCLLPSVARKHGEPVVLRRVQVGRREIIRHRRPAQARPPACRSPGRRRVFRRAGLPLRFHRLKHRPSPVALSWQNHAPAEKQPKPKHPGKRQHPRCQYVRRVVNAEIKARQADCRNEQAARQHDGPAPPRAPDQNH